MSPSSKPHGNNNSHTTESEWDETITIIATGLAKVSGVPRYVAGSLTTLLLLTSAM
jgi:hypothetical protein